MEENVSSTSSSLLKITATNYSDYQLRTEWKETGWFALKEFKVGYQF